MLTDNGTNISYRTTSTSFTISYPGGEIKNVELGNNGDRPYILPINTEITDDSIYTCWFKESLYSRIDIGCN